MSARNPYDRLNDGSCLPVDVIQPVPIEDQIEDVAVHVANLVRGLYPGESLIVERHPNSATSLATVSLQSPV